MNRPRRPRRWLLVSSLAGVAVISVADWMTPAGVVVGLLLALPILLASLTAEPRTVWLVTGAAAVGFLVAAQFGRGPISPGAVWVPNRILAFLAIPAAGALALVLQRRQRRLERAQQEALASSHLNRLLLSLLAHDLRAPVGTAIQVIDYLMQDEGGKRDRELVEDVRTRLRRSLSAIDTTLSLARAGGPAAVSAGAPYSADEIAGAIEAEASSFADESRARGKELRVKVRGGGAKECVLDLLVLRQAVAILVDNAVRHAVAGPIRVTGDVREDGISVRVEDEGPGLQARRRDSSGSGLGLELCRALVSRSGGTLTTVRDEPSGTAFELSLPVGRPHRAAR